ncbi:hypothetical protein SUGI_0944620 [Cryptomeria japonica]|uniref:uncharacterized protein LOC131039335 n=1 Tax=Cryptomeria japonica TaxID=3369 RepID=UPI002414B9A0|nr:uncharacterized protein LOC131039335 [Cryptomeria japonica]GLJ44874.1 hypothetical protein SUGI_0944620 [Cryptomeria japonica]
MGNRSCSSTCKSGDAGKIKVLHANGSIILVKGPIKAGELLEQHPGYWICHSEAFYIGKPIAGLPSNEDLKVGHTYFLLPRRSFQSALTVSTVASFISKVVATSATQNATAKGPRSNANMQAKPFKIQKKGDSLQVKISANFLADLVMENGLSFREHSYGSDSKRPLCDSYQLMEDYAKLVRPRSRPWKPKLSTIKETDHGKPAFLLRLFSHSVRGNFVYGV